VRLNSHLLIAINNLYSAHMRLGETDAAWQLRGKNGVNWRNNPYYHFNLGETSAATGNFHQAIQHYQTAIHFKDDEQQFYLSLAKAQFKLQQHQLAANNLHKAEQLNGGNADDGDMRSVSALLSKI